MTVEKLLEGTIRDKFAGPCNIFQGREEDATPIYSGTEYTWKGGIMTLIDIVRSTLLAGFGIQEKVKETIEEFVKKGELSESQGAKLVKEFTEKAEKSSDELSKTVTELITKTLERMNLPTKDDIDGLNKKIKALSTRVKKLEEASESTGRKEA